MAISATTIHTERMIKAVLFCFFGGDGVNPGGIPLPCPFGDVSVVGYIVAVLLELWNGCICGAYWPVPEFPMVAEGSPKFC